MSEHTKKELLGDICAYIPPAYRGEKARYPRCGTAFKDSEGRISLKIDTLPIPESGWMGWLNIFPPKAKTNKDGGPYQPDLDDDIPF